MDALNEDSPRTNTEPEVKLSDCRFEEWMEKGSNRSSDLN